MSTLGLGCRAGQRPIILGRMTDPVDHELPDFSHTLAFLELNGIPIKKLPHPVIPTDDDVLLIEIVPIGSDAVPEKLLVTMPELREMEDRWKNNQLNLVAPISGGPGSPLVRSNSVASGLSRSGDSRRVAKRSDPTLNSPEAWGRAAPTCRPR